MSRIPPALLYLTIYNPTLRPDISATHDDDDDAEEQAQILFYTSRDRAVSRDKMLRQVGLAKALVNFAEIFHSTDPCQNVHSQSRRMVMVSPEPHFWMHVAVELAKTPRPPVPKPKNRDKGKGKAKEEEQSQVQLEYHDGSLHDYAIRAHLLRAYEQFKLTHGSFCSTLSSLGRQALELQLERFFTVWAWSWDLDKDFSFGANLGLPLHPSYPLIHPIIDNFASQIPEGVDALVVTQSRVAPSSRYRNARYPVALARHLMNHLVPTPGFTALPPSMSQLESSNDVGHGEQDDRQTTSTESAPGGFLGVSISTSMDIRKWAWPSFGKGPPLKALVTASNGDAHLSGCERAEAQIDQNALEEAITSENSFGLPVEKPCALDDHEKHVAKLDEDVSTPRPSRTPSPVLDSSKASSNCSPESNDTVGLYGEKPQFTWTDVFLSPTTESLETSKRRVYLLKRGQHAVALLGHDLDMDGVDDLMKSSLCLLEDVDRIVSEDSQRNMEASLPSAAKILQPKDSHVLKSGDYVNASSEADLDSDHLFEAKGLLDRDPLVAEVFSRGLHPQHWHVAARVTDLVEDGKGEAYLEVSRKEATLSDVDNILRGLYKTHV